MLNGLCYCNGIWLTEGVGDAGAVVGTKIGIVGVGVKVGVCVGLVAAPATA